MALSDADSLTLLDGSKTQHKVRIAGIDAPEQKEPYSSAAKDNLALLVSNRKVLAACYKRDRYGRNVCRVYTDEGQNVGLEQVRAGMAWHFKKYAYEQTT